METAKEQAPGKETSQGKGSRLRGGELQRCDQQGMTARAPSVFGRLPRTPSLAPYRGDGPCCRPRLLPRLREKSRGARRGAAEQDEGAVLVPPTPRHARASTSSPLHPPRLKKKKTGTHLVTVPHLSSPQSSLIKAKEAAKKTLYELDRG